MTTYKNLFGSGCARLGFNDFVVPRKANQLSTRNLWKMNYVF